MKLKHKRIFSWLVKSQALSGLSSDINLKLWLKLYVRWFVSSLRLSRSPPPDLQCLRITPLALTAALCSGLFVISCDLLTGSVVKTKADTSAAERQDAELQFHITLRKKTKTPPELHRPTTTSSPSSSSCCCKTCRTLLNPDDTTSAVQLYMLINFSFMMHK